LKGVRGHVGTWAIESFAASCNVGRELEQNLEDVDIRD